MEIKSQNNEITSPDDKTRSPCNEVTIQKLKLQVKLLKLKSTKLKV